VKARFRTLLHAGLVLALVHAPRLAEACAVCSAGRDDESRLAFQVTTFFMSVTPLLIIGGGVFWLWRRVKAAEMREADARIASDTALAPRK
jgi:ABC-type nickel/cobalt efflux system permease component RcnA